MNHIYKSIFNKALGVFTAVPEFASAHGKGSERAVVGRVAKGTAGFAASALAISVGLALTSTSAVAGPGIYINDGTDTGCLAIPDAQSPNVGIHGISGGAPVPGLSLLGPSQVVPDKSYYGLDVMKPCLSSTGTAAEERSTQTNRTLFYGGNSYTKGTITDNGAKNLTLGGRLDVNSGIIGVGDRGVNGTDATNSIRMGTGTTLDNANKKVNTIAVGVNASTPEDHGIAIGEQSAASGVLGSLAIGKNAVAAGPVSLAQGTHAYASDRSGVAIGEEAKSSGIGHVAMGFRANAQTADADKDDTPATNKASYGVTIGHFAGSEYTGTDNVSTVAIGNKAGQYNTGGDRNVQIGDYSGRYVNGSRNIAIGSSAGSGDDTTRLTVNDTTAIGGNAKALTNQSIAIGRNSQSGKADVFGGDRSLAIGDTATAMGTTSIAIGANSSTSNGHDSIALGTNASTSNQKATAIGSFSAATGKQSLVIANNYGSKGVQPISVASGDRATAIGVETTVSGNNSLAIGDTNTVASARTYAIGNNINVAAGASDSLVFGTKASVGGPEAIALGNTANSKTDGAISIGAHTVSGDGDLVAGVEGNKSISIGYESIANRYDTIAMGVQASTQAADSGVAPWDAVAIGSKSKATTYKALAIGAYSQATGRQSTVIGNDIQGQNSTASGERSQILGVQSNVSGDNSVSIGDTNTIASARTYAIGNNINAAAGTDDSLVFGTRASVGGNNAIAMGNTATALANGSVAISNQSKAKTTYSIALGQGAVAGDDSAGALNNGEAAIAIGREASANVYNGIALGKQATVKKDSSDGIAIGSETKVNAYKGTAIGAFSEANGSQALAIGNNKQGQSSVASGERSQVIGVESNVSGQDSTAIGYKNTVAAARTYAMGNNINVAAGVDDALAFGTRAAVGGANAIALGNTASAATNYSIAVGQGSSSTGDSSISIGKQSSAKADSAIAHGDQAEALAQSSTAIGFRAKAQGYEQVSIGSNAGNGSPVNAVNYGAVFVGLHAGAGNNSAVGNTNGVAIGANAGQNAVSGIKNVAVGSVTGQYVEGSQNLALSFNAGNSVKGDNNLAMMVGAGNNIEGGNNIAIGTNANSGTPTAKRVVTNSIAMGANTQATSNNTMAIGPQARALAADAVALGLGSLSNHANSVALGAGSATSAAHTGAYTLNTSYTAAGLPVAANGTVSVGSAGKERQIQNVAAGVISATSTDAINGSQLYATNNYMNNFAGDVKTKLGGNAALGNDGHLTMTNIGGTGENTVDDAIKNLKTAIDNKADTTASVTSENQADIKVDKEAPVGNTTNYKLSLGNDAKAKLAKAATALQTVEGDSNITATKDATDPTKVKLALNRDLTADSVTLGDTTTAEHVVLNKDGLTVGNLGPALSNSGIDMRGGQIGNLVGGPVKYGERTAVSAGMLYDVAKTVQQAIGGETELDSDDPNKSLPSGRLTLSNVGETGESTIHDAIKSVNDKAKTAVQEIESANPTALSVKKDGTKVTLTPNFITGDLVNADGTVNAPAAADEGKLVSAKTVADALKANHFVVDTKGNTETGSEADAKVGSGNKVTFEAGNNLVAKQANTANGGATVKFSLKDDISLNSVTAGTGDNQVVLNDAGVNVGNKNYINKDGLNANGNKVANVKAGDVSATSTDAVNGAQLHNVATSVANVLGGNAAVDGNGNVTSSDIGGTGANTVDDAIKAVNATAAKHTTVVEGKNVKVTKGKNAAGGDEYTVATKDDLDVTSVTAGNTTVNTNGLTITGGPSVTRGGIDAGNRVISGVKAGDVSATSQEAVNGSQLHATNTKLDGVKAKADTAVQDVKSGDENALTAVKDPNTNIVTVTPKLSGDLVDANGNITAPTTPADKGKLVTAGTVADALANTHFVVDTKATDGELDTASEADQKIKAGNKVTLQAGKNLKAKQTNGANGAQVEFSLKDSISLKEVTAGEGANQVVLGNDGVKVGGNTYINNAGLNANGNKITNVADGVDPTDAVNKGQLDAVKTVADSAVKSVDVANGEQNLVVDNSDPKNPKLSLKKDLIVDSVKAGDSTLNNDGLTIAGGPSVKKDGINAGDKTITNVAPGAVTAASKDAVNGGQLYNVANNVKDLIGPDAAIDPATGKVTIADPAKGIGETGKGNIGDAIKHVNDAAKAAADTAKKHTTVEQGDNIVVEESLNADGGKHYKVSTARDLDVDSVKAGDTTVNNDGVTIAGGPSVTKAGINAGGNTITNVADGVNPNDAVNKGQLDAVKGVADSAVKSVDVANGEQNLVVDNSDPKNPKLSLKKDLTVDSVTAGDSTLNNDGLTIAGGPSVKKDGINAGDKKITNVKAGDVAENSKDAVNGGQLHNVAKGVADVLGGDAAVDGDGKVTMTNIGETGKGNVNDAIKHVNDAVKAAADTAKKHTTVEQGDNILVEESLNADGGKHYKVSTAKNLNVDSVKAGDTTVNNDGVTINNGPSMTKDGINANNTKVTNVADGVDAADAVNKGQLDKVDTKVSNVAQNVVNVLGGDATVNGNGDITMSNIGETGKGNINDAIKSVNDLAKKAAAEKTSVKAKEGRSNVTVTEGVNAAGGHEYTVDVERSVTNAGSDYVTVTNNHDADTNTTTYTVDVSAKTKASLAKADSAVQGLTSKDGNLNFTKGANGNVEVSFNDNLNVKNVTTDRVQVANGPSMSKDGINAAGKAISNVANGNVAADSKDAVNGGQLHETAKSVADVIGGGATVKDGKVVAGQNGIGNTGQNTVHGAIAAINQNTANNFNQIRGDLRKMDRDLRGGIAGALATAGLPQAFRPGKSMVAAAASTYRGQSGLAIGVSRISDNGKVILKVTGNTNSRGDFGGTIGAGYQW